MSLGPTLLLCVPHATCRATIGLPFAQAFPVAFQLGLVCWCSFSLCVGPFLRIRNSRGLRKIDYALGESTFSIATHTHTLICLTLCVGAAAACQRCNYLWPAGQRANLPVAESDLRAACRLCVCRHCQPTRGDIFICFSACGGSYEHVDDFTRCKAPLGTLAFWQTVARCLPEVSPPC